MKIIGITGRIGSGKSMVCRILTVMGYPVYDCDINAKRLLLSSTYMIGEIEKVTGLNLKVKGYLDKSLLADVIFKDEQKLAQVNKIIHTAVKNDFQNWIEKHAGNRLLFVESAILQSSGMETMVDDVWWVDAASETRGKRVSQFRNISNDDFLVRDSRQSNDNFQEHHKKIVNDRSDPLLPQIERLLSQCLE